MKNLFLSLLLLCAGCSSVSEGPRPDTETKALAEEANTASVVTVEKILSESAAKEEPQPVLTETNLPPAIDGRFSESAAEPFVGDDSGLPTLVVDEFTVNKDSHLGPVLRTLARIADVNIAFGDSVENLGPFRFHLNHPTPWDEVFESILNVYHLSFGVRGKIITVMTLDDMTRRYDLEKQENEHLAQVLRQKTMSPLVLQVVNVKYVKAETVVEPLAKLLQQSANEGGEEVRGSISVDKSNNNVVLHAPATEMKTLISLLNQMDRQARQVRIEASLVEVSSQVALELGVQWAFHANDTMRPSEATREPLEVSPMSLDDSGNFTLPDTTYRSMQGLVDSAAGIVDYGIIGRDFALGMNLQALEKDGKIKILSRPSLTTMDNHKAIIKSGSDVPFRSQDQYGNPVVEYKEAVLSLNVLPQIVDDIAIYLDVAITKDEPDFSQSVDGNPLVLKKFIETRMMVLDGQTAVIAGLAKNSQFNSNGGIPILRRIPLLGRLFSFKSKKDSEEELMIFLTPRIVPSTALDNSAIVDEWMNRNYHKAP